MRGDLKDKKEKIRIVAVRLAEQMKHHIQMYEERHQAMDRELKQMSQNLHKKQKSAETEVMRSLEEMDKDVQEGFVKVGTCLESLEKEVEDKNKLFQDKMREAMKSVQDVLGKEGRAWRNQIREISLINEMHQHIILESFQSSNGHIENLEKCLADLNEELISNFNFVEETMVKMRAEVNTSNLILKIQTNLRFSGMTSSLDKLKKTWNKDVKKIKTKIDVERSNAMSQINPMKMQINKVRNELGQFEKKVDLVDKEMKKGTGGLRKEIQIMTQEVKEITKKNQVLKGEVQEHIQDQTRLLKEYKEEMDKDKQDILKEFKQKQKEMEDM